MSTQVQPAPGPAREFAAWLADMGAPADRDRRDGRWIEWPTPHNLVRCGSRPFMSGYLDLFGLVHHVQRLLLSRRLARRQARLRELGIFGFAHHRGAELGVGEDCLYLPVRTFAWRCWCDDADASSPGHAATCTKQAPGWKRFVEVPDAYLPWLEPEELRWLHSHMLAASRAANVRTRSDESTKVRFTTPALATLVVGVAAAAAAVVRVL